MSYEFHSLSAIFREHAIKLQKHQDECVEEFKKNNPDEPLPSDFKDGFNIVLAFVSIIEHIEKLEREHNELKDRFNSHEHRACH